MKKIMSLIKVLFRLGFYFFYLFITVLILLEITFRILPTSDSLMIQAVNENQPIIHFKKNRTINKQIGFNFTHINKKNINNFGYATDREFIVKDLHKKIKNKIAAVIGDSFVEAYRLEMKIHSMLCLINLIKILIYIL